MRNDQAQGSAKDSALKGSSLKGSVLKGGARKAGSLKSGALRGSKSSALKQQLPYPYNQDLSKVLRGLKRRNPIGRRRQANDPVTAAYLAAAMQLVQRHLGPGVSRVPGEVEDPDSIERPLLSFLSQRAVAAEVNHNPPPFHRVGRVSTMRERWRHQSDFIADVIRFGLMPCHFPAAHQDEVADAQDEVIRGPDPVRGVHRLCYWNLTRLLDTPMFRLQIVATAQAEGDPVICEATSERDRASGLLWKSFLEEFLQARGLRLRRGVTLENCLELLAALADGLAMRALSDPGRVVDRAARRSVFSTAALALIAGCLEGPHPDGLSLEEKAGAVIGGASASPAGKRG